MLTLKAVKKYFNDNLVLDIPRLEIEAGLCYAVLGGNGAGKSTMLRIIAGVLEADAGEIDFSSSKNKGYLPQKPYIFSGTVERNMKIALRRNKPENEADLIRETLHRVGLAGFEKRKAGRLSGGEQARLCFARALAVEHDLLIIDEAMAATDVIGTVELEHFLMDYKKKYQSTILFTTHTPAQALRIADWIIFMDHGKVLEAGPARELWEDPRTAVMKEYKHYWSGEG